MKLEDQSELHSPKKLRSCRFSALIFIRTGVYRTVSSYVSDSGRYVSGIGRYGREIQSHRYTGEYPTRSSHFPVRIGRYGTYRPIFRTLLFTAHPPFQIDANFGFSAAIAEMLLQSTVKDLYLLPALPREKWANGCVKGLKARGGVTVNICWNEGNLHEVGLWSKNQNSIRLHFGGIAVAVKMSSATVYTFNNQLKCVKTYSLLDAAFL